jgi:Domain of unknown function (DUF4340)
MQRGRNLLILLVLGLGLGGYVYFVEMKREPASATADGSGSGSESRKKVFGEGLEAAKIEELRLTSSSGDRTTLKKSGGTAGAASAGKAGGAAASGTGGTWQIVEPIQSPVDETEVTSVTSNLATLESTRVVEENAKDLAKYGLAEPKVEVAFKAAGDKDYRRLFVGGKTPTGGDLYAKLANDSKVLLIPAYLESSLDRSTFQLRDKSILKFERDQVNAVEIASGPMSMTFTKQGDTWAMTHPYRARTDATAVDGLLGRIGSGQMKSLAAQEATPADLHKYGLVKPAAIVTMISPSGRTGLMIGAPSPTTGAAATPAAPGTPPGAAGSSEPTGEGVYAKDVSRPLVFTVDKTLADDLKKGPADYRLKDIFDFREFSGTKMEVTRGGATVTFEKKKEAPAPAANAAKDAAKDAGKAAPAPPAEPVEKWTQVAPQPAKPIEEAKINDIAAKVASLRADTFVERLPPGSTELMTIATTFDQGKKSEKVVLYKAGADYYAIRPDDTGAAKLPMMGVEDIIKALDAAK